MRRPRSVRKLKQPGKGSARRARARFVILVGAMAVASVLIGSLAGSPTLTASASQAPGQAKEKRYKATRAFVMDKQTGEVRMPTETEVNEVVANLTAMGQRPVETLRQSSQANGGVLVHLDGGFGGVLLGRPNADGTWETRCVFTLEEGAEFLGIVEDDSSR
jgi:hypothetical protein